jgi:hypothetical protein
MEPSTNIREELNDEARVDENQTPSVFDQLFSRKLFLRETFGDIGEFLGSKFDFLCILLINHLKIFHALRKVPFLFKEDCTLLLNASCFTQI